MQNMGFDAFIFHFINQLSNFVQVLQLANKKKIYLISDFDSKINNPFETLFFGRRIRKNKSNSSVSTKFNIMLYEEFTLTIVGISKNKGGS